MSKWILSLASVAMLALAMSGCGGSDGSSQVDGGTTPPVAGGGGSSDDLVRNTVINEPEGFASLPAVPMPPVSE